MPTATTERPAARKNAFDATLERHSKSLTRVSVVGFSLLFFSFFSSRVELLPTVPVVDTVPVEVNFGRVYDPPST